MKLAVLAVAGLVSVSSSWKIIAQHTETGGFTIVAAQGVAHNPTALQVSIVSKPSVTTEGNYYVKCAGKVKRANFPVTTPLTKSLPVTAPHAASCLVVVGAQLTKQGRMTITIRAH